MGSLGPPRLPISLLLSIPPACWPKRKTPEMKATAMSQSQVHTQETSRESHVESSYRTRCLHFCKAELVASQTTYRAIDASEGTNREGRLLECRDQAWFIRHSESGEVRVTSRQCRLRWCPLCSRSRSFNLQLQVQSWFSTVKTPKFLTLTVKHTDQDLAEQLTRLYKSFQNFRKRAVMAKKCHGGVWFFQLCFNPKTNEWHPHLHCVIDSEYISHNHLSKLWLKITGDSKVVDIRTVRDPKKVAEYVAKYAARPSQLESLSGKRCIELVTAMHGRRMCGSWGTAKGVCLRPRKADDADKWQRIGSYSTVMITAAFDDRSKRILEAYTLNRPLAEDCYVSDYDFFIDSEGEYNTWEPIPPPPPLLWQP